MRLTMGKVSFLLTGDATEDTELALIDNGVELGAEVLKVGHHGSATSTSEAFLEEVAPVVDVVSVGADNVYGHPTEDVLARLGGDAVLRTDVHGDIMVETDGERLWVRTQKHGDLAE
jgi:competence protein ComEC